MLGAVGAAWEGSKKHPAETGQSTPPTDLRPFILTVLRELNRKHDNGTRMIDARFDDQTRLLGRIYTDTQMIRDRGER